MGNSYCGEYVYGRTRMTLVNLTLSRYCCRLVLIKSLVCCVNCRNLRFLTSFRFCRYCRRAVYFLFIRCFTSRSIQGGVLMSRTVFFRYKLINCRKKEFFPNFPAFIYISMIRYGGVERDGQEMLSDSIEVGVFKVVDCSSYRFCSLKIRFDVEFDTVMIRWE